MSEVVQRDVDQVKAIAQTMGLVCFLPMYNELLIDLDIPYDGNRLAALIPHKSLIDVLERNGLHITDRLITRSKSDRCHLYYKVSQDLNDLERMVLQAIFDSDKVREALSFVRLIKQSHAPIALFETTGEAARVFKWRDEWKARKGEELL